MGAAVERVVDATRDLVETRVELIRLEMRESAKRAGRTAGLLGVGIALLGVAWMALCAATALALTRVAPTDVAAAVVGGANLVLAAACVAAARRGAR